MNFWDAFWEGCGEVLRSFWSLGGTFWEVGRELEHKCAKKGGGHYFLLSPSGQQNASRELAGRCPENRKIGRRRPEERTKSLCEEEIVKTSKTSTLSSEKRGLGGRGGPKIVKNRSRSGLESKKSTIIIQH